MRSFAIYSIIIAAAVVVAINPVTVFLTTEMRSFAAYALFIDLWLALIIVAGALYLRSGRRLFGIGTVALVGLSLPAMVLGEALYVYVRHVHAAEVVGDLVDIYREDPELGYVLKPETVVHHESPGNFTAQYETDKNGRKKIKHPREARQSVHVFGDSFTFGYGVSNQDTWLNLVQDELDDQYSVYNYGVAGYSLEQMYLTMERQADQIDEGDIVILAPVSDDLRRSVVAKTFVCSQLIRPQGSATFPKLGPDGWITVDLREECNYYLDTLLANSIFPVSAGALVRSWHTAARHRAMIDNADRVIAEARRLAEERGARFQLLFLATPDECAARAFAIDISALRSDYQTLLPYCPDDPEAAMALRFPHDGHWNERGHRWAADALLSVLDQWPMLISDPREDDGQAAPGRGQSG